MMIQTTTQKTTAPGKGRCAALLGLALGVALAGVVALGGTAQKADAASSERIVFTSNRTGGTGVANPTGDYEVFRMNPDGTGVRQLTFNKGDDFEPVLSPDGTKVAYHNRSVQASDGQGGGEIFVMNALDGSGKKNLTNSTDVDDYSPVFSPSGRKIAYVSYGAQISNSDGDNEVYVVNASDGSGKKNLTNNDVGDYFPTFSPDGTKIAYNSEGIQDTNPEGDTEVYVLNASDGLGKKNLTNSDVGVSDFYPDFSPDGKKIAYESVGEQNTNPEGDAEVYVLNASDGSGQTNFTNNGPGVNDSTPDYSPGGKRIAYTSEGDQTSNPGGDYEVYRMNALDGSGQTNLSNNGGGVTDGEPVFSADGTRVVYLSYGKQTSNPEGDWEIYRLNTLDGKGKKNLTDNRAAVDGIYYGGGAL